MKPDRIRHRTASGARQRAGRLLLLGGLALLSGLAAVAAEPPKKPATPAAKPAAKKGDEFFADTVNVSVVNVDVFVTDGKGNAVNGLTKDDFQLFEDGRPVEVTNFYAVEGGRSTTAPAPAATAPAPSAQRTLESLTVPEDQRLRLVIYVDNFNLKPFDRNKVLRELRAFLGQHLGRQDQAMLVTYDREIHIRVPFTSDPSLLAASMVDIEKISAQGVHAESDRRDTLQRIEDSESVTEAENLALTYARSEMNDHEFSLDGLANIVNGMAGLPGRKAVVYVSDGLQMMVGQDVFYAVHNKYNEQTSILTEGMQYDMSRRFRELTAQANANRVTFYTIDAAGLRTFSSTDASVQGVGPTSPGSSQLVDSIQIQNVQSTLQTLAEDTGGQVIMNTNAFTPGLEKMARDFGSYYSLGYTPPHYGDGRYYKIEVKLKNKTKGIKIRHREGYRDKSTESRMNDGTLAALKFTFEDNPLAVAIEIGETQRRDDGLFLVPILVRIPIGKLVLVPRETSEEAKVRIFVAAIDGDGNTSEVQQSAVPISVPKEKVAEAVGKYYVYTLSLLMRGGDQRIAVGVRDDIAAQASFLSRGVRVGS